MWLQNSNTTTGPTKLPCHAASGTHSTPDAHSVCHRQHHRGPDVPRETLQKLALQHTRAIHTTTRPTLLRSALQHCWLRPCSCLCLVPCERHHFDRPPASNFESKHHQLGPVPLLDEFRAGSLLAPPGFREQLRLCPLPHIWQSRHNGERKD